MRGVLRCPLWFTTAAYALAQGPATECTRFPSPPLSLLRLRLPLGAPGVPKVSSPVAQGSSGAALCRYTQGLPGEGQKTTKHNEGRHSEKRGWPGQRCVGIQTKQAPGRCCGAYRKARGACTQSILAPCWQISCTGGATAVYQGWVEVYAHQQ